MAERKQVGVVVLTRCIMCFHTKETHGPDGCVECDCRKVNRSRTSMSDPRSRLIVGIVSVLEEATNCLHLRDSKGGVVCQMSSKHPELTTEELDLANFIADSINRNLVKAIVPVGKAELTEDEYITLVEALAVKKMKATDQVSEMRILSLTNKLKEVIVYRDAVFGRLVEPKGGDE